MPHEPQTRQCRAGTRHRVALQKPFERDSSTRFDQIELILGSLDEVR